MQEQLPEVTMESHHQDKRLCKNCQVNESIEGYSNPLCLNCRQLFINYPIPPWIWLFAAGILVIMVVGMVRMPTYVSAAIHLSRAEKAMDANLYLTAQRELQQVLTITPDNLPANARMFVAGFHNRDMPATMGAYNKLVNKHIEDSDLLQEVNDAITRIESRIPQDSTLNRQIEEVKDSPEKLKRLFAELDSTNSPDVLVAGTLIANKLYDFQDYAAIERILEKVLERQDDYYDALGLMTAVKRNLGKYDEALQICDILLIDNQEDVSIISQKARIELKHKQDDQAALYARTAMLVNKDDILAQEAQAMVDFYANRKQESLRLLDSIRRQEIPTGDSTVSVRLSSIINGTTLYR
jgi:tetratricopeptide (TPR) repeat protein